MAIVTASQAAGFGITSPQPDNTSAQNRGRAPIWVQLWNPGGSSTNPDAGFTTFWNVHAGAYGNNYNDADNIIQTISNIATNFSGSSSYYAILGDFNRSPEDLRTLPNRTYLYRPGQRTHQSGRELDYMVSNESMNGWSAGLLDVVSDHIAVEFGPGAGARGNIALKNTNKRQCLDVHRASRINGTNSFYTRVTMRPINIGH